MRSPLTAKPRPDIAHRMPGVWDGEHAGAVPGRVALRQPPWLRPSHYEESISVGQECRGEIPLLWGREPPDVVTR
jgi:hypothetical protein